MMSQPAIRQMRLVYQCLLVLILLICATNPVSAATTAADSAPGFWPDAGNLATYSGRALHTAVWTGTEMIIWGGSYNEEYLNTGARYNPVTDTWKPISTTNAPICRILHTAVWTGTEMIVWGGVNSGKVVNTGGRYNPATDTWKPISTANAPTARYGYTAVWTGTEMIIWGGISSGKVVNTGGRYNPDTDTWTPIPTINAPTGRAQLTAVWTGTEMIVWGGTDGTNFFNTGGRYNPAAPDDVAWTPVTTTNAPTARGYHTAVWTGTEMIVWGGTVGTNFFNTGGRYNPALATWSSTPTANAPVGRYYHTAVWTGTEMVVWGGKNSDDLTKDIYFDTGGVYNPAASDDVAWTPTATTNAPVGRYYHTAVWTGTGMIVWGGYDDKNVFGTGGRYYTSNSDPTISDISDRTTIINAPIPAIPFTVGDRETGADTLTLNAVSSNHVLLPDENILLEGSGADRTITVSPVAGEAGTTTISLTVSDGVNTAAYSFELTVDPHRVWLPLISTVSD